MEFLQSPYFLIGAIAAIVVLVVLLIIIRVRARKAEAARQNLMTMGEDQGAPATGKSRKPAPTALRTVHAASTEPEAAAPEETPAAAPLPDAELTDWLSRPAPGEPDFSTPPAVPAPGVPQAPEAPHAAAAAVSPTVAPAAQPGAATRTSPVTPSMPPSPRPFAEPGLSSGRPTDIVLSAVTAIAKGMGPLEQFEKRRLDLYRPDRVLKAVETLRSNVAVDQPSAAATLDRLRAISEYVTATMSAHEVPGTESAAAPEAAPLAPEAPQAPEAPAASEAPSAPDAGEQPVPAEPEPAVVEEPVSAAPEEPAAAAVVEEPVAAAEEPAVVTYEQPVEFVGAVPVVDMGPSEAIPVEVDEAFEIQPEQVVSHAIEEEIFAPEPLATSEEPVSEAAAALAATQPEAAESGAGQPATAEAAESGAAQPEVAALAAPPTAEEVARLQPQEWDDALQRLPVAELGRLLQISDDTTLKMKIVDQLERIGGPAALKLLDSCLTDPDPEVQLYALNTAERLLKKKG